MSRYNHFARDLDIAFRAARDEYAAAYDNLEQARQADTDAKAWRPNDNEEDKRLRIATAGLELSRVDAAFKISEARTWSEFDMKCKELRKELEKDVQKSGALTVEDYYSFAERYESNATMLRVISKYALDASENADDTKAAVALRILSDNCKTGMGTVLRAWNELEGVASYCSGRGGSSRTAIDPTHIISMGKWWEELAGQAIENF